MKQALAVFLLAVGCAFDPALAQQPARPASIEARLQGLRERVGNRAASSLTPAVTSPVITLPGLGGPVRNPIAVPPQPALTEPVAVARLEAIPGVQLQPLDRPLGNRIDASSQGSNLAPVTGPPILMPAGLPMTRVLEPYGYDFFERGRGITTQPISLNTPADYRIGPGDMLAVHIWSKMLDETFVAEVSADGRIPIPRGGELFVLGTPYGELDRVIQKALAKSFTELSVATRLAKLRSFQVLVTGETVNPGPVSVNALNTSLNALMAAGGPTRRGSLRAVTVSRGGQQLARIDYYELLLGGRAGLDPKLQDGDVVHVPIVGRTAAISGMVKRPAIYELADGDTLADLVRYAGGLSAAAYTSRIVLSRVREHSEREIQDIRAAGDFKGRAAKVVLRDGDVVDVPAITTTARNKLTLRGHVERPGEYEWRQGMRLRELVKLGRSLLPGALMTRAELLRVRQTPASMEFMPNLETETIREFVGVDLGKAMRGEPEHNLELRPDDDLRILSIRDSTPAPRVTIAGEVNAPGVYELASGMRIRDLVFLAGSVTPRAHLSRAEHVRRRGTSGYDTRPIDLGRALQGDPAENVVLENHDHLSVQADPKLTDRIRVFVTGQICYPGEYLMERGDTLARLLKRAGGFTPSAFLQGAIFSRFSVQLRQEAQKKLFVDEQRRVIASERTQAARLPTDAKPIGDPVSSLSDAEELLNRLESSAVSGRLSFALQEPEKLAGSSADILLEDGDSLHVPMIPSEVSVTGEVFTPNAFLFEPGHTVEDYIDRAGGFTARAWTQQIYLLRADGSASSARRPDRHRKQWNGLNLVGRDRAPNFFELEVQRGDAIFVPTDYRVRRDRAAEVIDRIYKVAVSVGALAGVFR